MDPASTTILAVLMFAAIILGLILSVLMILLPFFVLRIRKEMIRLNRTMDRVAYAVTHPEEMRGTADLAGQARQ